MDTPKVTPLRTKLENVKSVLENPPTQADGTFTFTSILLSVTLMTQGGGDGWGLVLVVIGAVVAVASTLSYLYLKFRVDPRQVAAEQCVEELIFQLRKARSSNWPKAK